MNLPQFKGRNVGTFCEKLIPLYKMRETDTRSLAGLYFSQLLMCTGIILILFNNLNVLSPGSYFGSANWLTNMVFAIGIFMNFLSVPFLYFSSFKNFKKADDFWDREIFWVMPLFFFGTFFIYGSQVSNSFILFIISIVVIGFIHFRFAHMSWKYAVATSKGSLANYYQYSVTLKYLTAYYALLVVSLIVYNPLQHLFVWIRSYA